MAVHTVFALVYEGEVKNVVVGEYYYCDIAAKETYGNKAFAVDVTQIPVFIGDIYENGEFYRMVDGEKQKVEPIPTDTERLDAVETKAESTSALLEEVATLVLELAEAAE